MNEWKLNSSSVNKEAITGLFLYTKHFMVASCRNAMQNLNRIHDTTADEIISWKDMWKLNYQCVTFYFVVEKVLNNAAHDTGQDESRRLMFPFETERSDL